MTETWLVEPARRALTPNRYTHGLSTRVVPLEAIVVHYTASRNYVPTLSWLRNPDAKVSAHFLIDRDGSMHQMAALEDRTWHGGGATSKLFGSGNVNGRTIGIELMNLGPLQASGNSFVAEADKKPWTSSGMTASDGSFWEPFPTAQIDTLVGLLDRIYEHHPGLKESKRLVGHQDVDPTRKRDPGPVFPWQVIRQRLGLGSS